MIPTNLGLNSSHDAGEAARKLLDRILQSQQPGVTQLIQQSLIIREILAEGSNLVNTTNEIDNDIIFLTRIRVATLEDALALYFSPVPNERNEIYQMFIQILTIIMFRHLQRRGQRDGPAFKDCNPIKFNQIIHVSAFANSMCFGRSYKLTARSIIRDTRLQMDIMLRSVTLMTNSSYSISQMFAS
jgi:hypothetical protein